MGKACAESNGNAIRNILRRKVGSFAHAGAPHNCRPDDTYDELSARNKPVGVDHVGSLLVVDIVEGVSGIPRDNKAGLPLGTVAKGYNVRWRDAAPSMTGTYIDTKQTSQEK